MTKPTNLQTLADRVRAVHEHVPVADVNDHRVTLAVNEVPYRWHMHPDSDELFIVLEGIVAIEFAEGPPVTLRPMDTYVVPAGTAHRTTFDGRCVNLVFEVAGTETRFLDAPSSREAESGERT